MASKCTNPWSRLHPGLRAFLVIAIFIVYLAIGAAIFQAIERQGEIRRGDIAAETQARIKAQIDDITERFNVSSEAQQNISALLQSFAEANSQLEAAQQNNWVYGASFFFSLTVVTTIGYGNISPSTRGGQLFFIFYALFGIPYTGYMLGMIGKGYSTFFNWIGRKSKSFQKHRKGFLFLVGLVTFVLFMLIPSAIFTAIEDWSYRDSMYYVFVTLTTVGFGDFVPGQESSQYREFYKICVGVWIILGLSVLALFIEVVANRVERRVEVTKDEEKSIELDKQKEKEEKEDVESE